MCAKGIEITFDIHLTIGNQIFYDLPEQNADPLFVTEAQPEINPDQPARDQRGDFIFTGIGRIRYIDMHQPIDIGPFGLFLNNGINDAFLNFGIEICTGQVDKLGGIKRYG